MRAAVLAWLADPNTAAWVVLAGILAIYLECVLPGAVLPGSLGGVLVLTGGYALALHRPGPWPLLLIGIAAALLVMEAWRGAGGLLLLSGTALLAYGLRHLLDTDPARVGWPHAVGIASVLGPLTVGLLRVAARASTNKQV